MWNWVGEAANLAVNKVWGWIKSWIEWLRDNLSNSITWVSNTIKSKISEVWDWINNSANWIVNTLTSTINYITTKVSEAGTWIVNTLREAITNVYESTKILIERILIQTIEHLKTVKDHLVKVITFNTSSIIKGVSSIGPDVIGTIGSKLANMMTWQYQLAGQASDDLTGAVEEIKKFFDQVLHAALSGVAEALGSGLKKLITWFIGGVKDIVGSLVSLVTGAVDWFKDTFVGFLTDIANRIRETLIPGSPPKELEEAMVGLGTDWQNRVLQEIEGAAKTPIEIKDVLKVATGIAGIGLGVTGIAIALGMAADVAHPVKQFGGRDVAKLLLAYLGVDATIKPIISLPYRIGVLKPLTHFFNSVYQTEIPGPGELVRFAVREAWRPELQEGTPDFFIENMLNMGFKEMWSKYFWAAHWIIPSYGQAREAMWRGVITEKDFADLRRYADLAPAYNHLWVGLQYNLPGVRASRWMYEWGTISKEELMWLVKAAGIHPDWIEKVADAYILNQLRDEVGRVRSTLVSLYISGYMSEEDLKKEISDLGFREEVVEMSTREAKLKRDKDVNDDYVKTFVTAFRKGKITEIELTGYLQELKVQTWKINALIDYEKARIKLEGVTEKITFTQAI